ncbi:MAG TPA: glycine cleavage system protein H [Hyphomicrobiaceae bacterium]|nr:glycine cleavage system protein H [Hyphomicrobiaceae bacterium]
MNEPEDRDPGLIEIRGCLFPKRLAYDVQNHIWYERLNSGSVRVGMTCVGAALASFRIFAVTPRRVGREFDAGTSIATIESSKWVGPARVAFNGVVEAVNDAVIENPSWLAEDPYGRGWILIARPRASNALDHLVHGDDIERTYLDWMNENDFPGCDRSSE